MTTAVYDALSPEDKAIVDAYTTQLRAHAGSVGRNINTGESIEDYYWGAVNAILTTFSAGDEVPNSSGLAGAVNLTKTELDNLLSYVQGVKTNYGTDAHQQLRAKAAGLQNTLTG